MTLFPHCYLVSSGTIRFLKLSEQWIKALSDGVKFTNNNFSKSVVALALLHINGDETAIIDWHPFKIRFAVYALPTYSYLVYNDN